MVLTCQACGWQNPPGAHVCAKCGKAIGEYGDLKEKDLRPFRGEETLIWTDGHLQVTTEAVLIGMDTDTPDVLPLEAVAEVGVADRCLILRMNDGTDRFCSLEQPEQVAELVREQMERPRYAHRRLEEPGG